MSTELVTGQIIHVNVDSRKPQFTVAKDGTHTQVFLTIDESYKYQDWLWGKYLSKGPVEVITRTEEYQAYSGLSFKWETRTRHHLVIEE